MQRLVGTAFMLGIAAAMISAPAPARAQFAGGEMEQFAPMLEMMKKRMGKRRYGQLMRTVGPMMADMMDRGGGAGGSGAGFGGYGLGSMRGVIGKGRSFNFRSLRGLGGRGRYGRRYSRRAWY